MEIRDSQSAFSLLLRLLFRSKQKPSEKCRDTDDYQVPSHWFADASDNDGIRRAGSIYRRIRHVLLLDSRSLLLDASSQEDAPKGRPRKASREPCDVPWRLDVLRVLCVCDFLDSSIVHTRFMDVGFHNTGVDRWDFAGLRLGHGTGDSEMVTLRELIMRVQPTVSR
jgi:hypothetical protein